MDNHFRSTKALLYAILKGPCIVLLCLFLPDAVKCSAQNDVASIAIGDQYKARRDRLQQVDVEWNRGIAVLAPTQGIPVKGKCRAAIKGEKRFYDIRFTPVSETKEIDANQHNAMSYDGKETRILMNAKHGRIWPGDKTVQFDAPDDFLALQGYPQNGYRIRWPSGSVSTDIVALLSEGKYHLVSDSATADNTLVQLVGPGDRIVMDPAKGYVIVQRDVSDAATSKPALRYFFKDFAEVLPGFWLAKRIDCESFTDSKVDVRTELKVSNLAFSDVPDDLFVLQFEPGVSISDVRHIPPDADGSYPIVGYRIPASPQDLDKVVAAAVARNQQFGADASRGRLYQRLLLTVNVLVIIAIVIFLVARRAKAS